MRYAVIFEKSDASYGAYVPDLPGCVAIGATLAEVKTLIAQAMKQHLEVLKGKGQNPPEPACVAAYIDA
ncbi:MAG: type II toxin-antitoxin system HicB family antitoxin [Pirellulaceae bacterium]